MELLIVQPSVTVIFALPVKIKTTSVYLVDWLEEFGNTYTILSVIQVVPIQDITRIKMYFNA